MPKPNPIDISELREHADRYWSKIQRRSDGECWPWVGEKAGLKGYGRFRIGKRSIIAHRVAYALTHGNLVQFACHSCDNPPCCNPHHLFEGDAKANSLDMVAKGRHVPRRTPPGTVHPDTRTKFGDFAKGERVHFAKLNPDKVRALREAYNAGATTSELGKRYGISQVAARNVIIRKAWRHID